MSNNIHFKHEKYIKIALEVLETCGYNNLTTSRFNSDWLPFLHVHLALDVHGVQLSVVVLGDDLHDILLLEGIFIHPLHRTHTLDGDGGAHLHRKASQQKHSAN